MAWRNTAQRYPHMSSGMWNNETRVQWLWHQLVCSPRIYDYVVSVWSGWRLVVVWLFGVESTELLRRQEGKSLIPEDINNTLQNYFDHLRITRASVILTLGGNWLVLGIWNTSLLAVWKMIIGFGVCDYPFTGFLAKLNSKERCLSPISSAKLDNFQTLNSLILSLMQMKFWFSAVS